jgi:transcriptional regulator with XRE-family HTH domain
VSFVSRKNLVAKLLNNKKYRDAYVLEHIKNGIPYQIRSLRDQRGWTQGYLGEEAGKRQHGISRLEDPRYGSKLSIKSLLEIASAFDVALLVKFVPFSKLLNEYDDVSPEALSANSIEDEIDELEKWAAEKEPETVAAHAKEDLSRSQSYSILPLMKMLSGQTLRQLEAKRAAYVNEFMARREFQEKYDSLTDPTAYVDALLYTEGLHNHPSRAGWIAGLTNASLTRAQVLRQLAESADAQSIETSSATNVISMQDYLAGRRQAGQPTQQNDLLAMAAGGSRK